MVAPPWRLSRSPKPATFPWKGQGLSDLPFFKNHHVDSARASEPTQAIAGGRSLSWNGALFMRLLADLRHVSLHCWPGDPFPSFSWSACERDGAAGRWRSARSLLVMTRKPEGIANLRAIRSSRRSGRVDRKRGCRSRSGPEAGRREGQAPRDGGLECPARLCIGRLDDSRDAGWPWPCWWPWPVFGPGRSTRARASPDRGRGRRDIRCRSRSRGDERRSRSPAPGRGRRRWSSSRPSRKGRGRSRSD